MRLIRSLALAVSAALFALPASAPASAKEYRLLSSWDQNYAYNPYILDPFVEAVKKATDGRVSISISGPEAVPPFEQVEPVGAGVFDFLFTHGAYHFGTSPIMTVADALEGDLAKVRESGLFDVLDKHYQQFGLKLVVLPVTPEGAYHIILRQPVSPEGDLRGRKIRGSLTYKGVIEMLGGVLVVLPPSEIYTGLEKGLVDGAAWPIIGALDYNWYEVAKYLLRPAFGVNYEPIFMNLNAWNALDKADQDAITKVGHDIEDSWYAESPAVWKKEEDALLAKGMTITEMGDAQKAKLREAWSTSLWAMAAEKNPTATKELLEFARSKGMAQ
ncbi:TRAP transporter substrate-binding protein DctP [Propylenella binzhouense]|nr:TRAP transporter substrate-binding protein DctP [Propylenella binzhouense]